jgi:3-oxoadipate enol-lactonase
MKTAILKLVLLVVLICVVITGNTQTTTTGYAKVNGTTLYYEVTGEGTPIIFLHGFTCDHRNWNPQVKYFSKKYKVITFDARGHGKSSMPDTIPYRSVDDLATLMDFLKIEKAVIVGHSMGGNPAFFYALEHPEKVLGLVLAEGGPVIMDSKLINLEKLQNYMAEISNLSNIARKEGIEKAKTVYLNISPVINSVENPKSHELVEAMISGYSGWHWFNRNPQKSYPRGTPELFSQIKAPTLLVTGELSNDALKEMVAVQDTYIPDSKKVVLKKSNHMLNIENPSEFNKEMKIFLKENNIH